MTVGKYDPGMTNGNEPRILILDVETAPAEAYVFSRFPKVVGLDNIKTPARLLCFAAKWVGERRVEFYSEWEHGRDGMLAEAHRLLDAADYVVHWNGQRFDVPMLNGEFLKAGMNPPAPHRNIDLMLQARRKFKLMSNALNWYARELGIGQKVHHQGIGLWRSILEETGDVEKSRNLMKRYNVQDVKLTETLFDRMRPWLTGMNFAVHVEDGKPCCLNCGSDRVQSRGFAYTAVSRYRQYACMACGKWMRGPRAEKLSELRGTA